MTLMAVLFLVEGYLNVKLKAMIAAQKEVLDRLYKNNDEVLEYCLKCIMAHALKEEVQDYETANRCKKLIEELNSFKRQ